MISVEQARSVIWRETPPLPCETTTLVKSLGRTLAEDIEAAFDIPPFDRAAMDGYAVRSADTALAAPGSPVLLVVRREIAAGARKPRPVGKGEAASIMTGALLPAGCDSVVRLEDAEEVVAAGGRKVRIFGRVAPGKDISLRGEDVRKGDIVLRAGRVIDSPGLAMLACLGRGRLRVRRRPDVAIVPTGDEIRRVGERLSAGQIYDSNSYGLRGQVLQCGGIPRVLGIAGDAPGVLARLIRKGLEHDMLLISGGVSAGKYDLVVDVFRSVGVKTLFWKVAVKPGMPVFFGKKGRTVVFGLPGYPVSSHLSFENFVRFAFARMLVQPRPERLRIEALLETPLVNRGDRDNFLRVRLESRRGRYWAIPCRNQQSGILRSLVEADGVVCVRKGETARNRVTVEIL